MSFFKRIFSSEKKESSISEQAKQKTYATQAPSPAARKILDEKAKGDQG